MTKEKLVLVNDLSPGDILIMSVAIRSLHKAYPDRFITDVRSPCNEIFMNNPYVQHIDVQDPRRANECIETLKKNPTLPPILVGDTRYIISHYPEIHKSGMSGLPFADGHRMWLEEQLDLHIDRSGMKPDIFFSDAELDMPHQVNGRYWLINAGIKNDYTLKHYPYYQEVVNLLKDKIQFVQIGVLSHNHPILDGVIDLRGKTTLRQLFILSKYAEGAVCPVSLQMVIMAALSKPCVVVSGAREGVRWQLNPDHRFLYTNGAMKCARYDGCWKSKLEECTFKSQAGNPMCMELIRPEDIVRAIDLYYLGGALEPLRTEPNILNLGEKMEVKEEITLFAEDATAELHTMAKEDRKIIDDGPIIRKDNNYQLKDVFDHETISLNFDSMHTPQITASIFNTLRILKRLNPTDTYLEAYQWHYNKRKETFMDTYHFMWYLGSIVKPKRILEIGSRTGLSICQLLSAYINYDSIERIVLCDIFNDGLAKPQVILDSLRYLNIPTDKVQFIVGDSLVEIPKLEGKWDYILIDGCHEKDYARQDLRNATKIIDSGGYLCFDDLTSDGCSLQDVWDEFKAEFKDSFTFYENSCGKGIGIAYANKIPKG